MNLYLIIEERYGIDVYAGHYFDKQKADSEANKNSFSFVIKATILPDMVEDETVYLGSKYDKRKDLHHYEGIFYSYEDAKKKCGDQGLITSIQLKG